MGLHKTTIVVWSDFDAGMLTLEQLAFEAEHGEAYCSTYRCEWIAHPALDPDWDGTEFFWHLEDDDDE